MLSSAHVVQQLIAITRELFSGMVMMDIIHVGEVRGTIEPLKDSITGMIGLAGTCRGVLAVHVPVDLSLMITGNFLGMEIQAMNDDVHDAIGEIANMLGGNVKSILTEDGASDIHISLPSTISGEEYTFITAEDNVDRLIIPFRAQEGSFFVELELGEGILLSDMA